jgi:hypothetical protein
MRRLFVSFSGFEITQDMLKIQRQHHSKGFRTVTPCIPFLIFLILLAYDTSSLVEVSGNVLPPSSGPKRKPRNQQAEISWVLSWRILLP